MFGIVVHSLADGCDNFGTFGGFFEDFLENPKSGGQRKGGSAVGRRRDVARWGYGKFGRGVERCGAAC